jgi:hypothetical protein
VVAEETTSLDSSCARRLAAGGGSGRKNGLTDRTKKLTKVRKKKGRSPETKESIPGGGKGDRPVGSPDVKAPDGWCKLVRSVQGGKQPDRP